MLMGKTAERLNLFGLINSAHFGGLGNRNDAWLRVMLIADTVISMADRVDRDLAILVGQRNQLAAGMLLRRSAFVRINVGISAAQHRVEGPGEGLQAQNIRTRAIEREKNGDVRSEMLFKFLDRRPGIRIVAIRHHVALVGADDGVDHLGMHARVVVAGEVSGKLVRNGGHTA